MPIAVIRPFLMSVAWVSSETIRILLCLTSVSYNRRYSTRSIIAHYTSLSLSVVGPSAHGQCCSSPGEFPVSSYVLVVLSPNFNILFRL